MYKSPKDLSYMQILQWIWVRGLVINADIFHKVLKASKMYWSQLKVVLFPTFSLHVLRRLERKDLLKQGYIDYRDLNKIISDLYFSILAEPNFP